MERNPFLKRLMKAQTEDVVHSSAYAQAQNQKRIGVASMRGFEERMRMENNRTTIKGYKDSEVVNKSFVSARAGKVALSAQEPTAQKPVTPPARKNPGISR